MIAGPRRYSDPLFRGIIGADILLLVANVAMLRHWGPAQIGPVIPWFAPLTYSFVALSALSVAVLALGRHLVLRDPASYWVGVGCMFCAVGYLFFILTWPGILPNGQSVLGHLANTPAWLGVCASSAMAGCFMMAVLARWPGPGDLSAKRWHLSVLCWLTLTIALCISIIASETSLPVLVGKGGAFSPLLAAWHFAMALIMAAGAILSARQYLQTGDTLLAYLSLTQVAIAFSGLGGIFRAGRFSLMYSVDRSITCFAFVAMIFALLFEYVGLFRREQEKSEALRESEQQFRTLGNSIPQLTWMANADGYIFWYNQRWYEYTGTTPAQMEGWGWQSVHDALELPKVLERWRTSIQTGEPFDMVFPLRGGDGIFRPFLTRVVPMKNVSGQVVRWFGTNTDISDQKKTERALREGEQRYRELSQQLEERVRQRTADLEAVNKELEAFSYSVSHDLRAPLRTLDGFSEALLGNSAGIDEKGVHYLQRIRAATQRMRHLIDGLLQLSRLSRAQLQSQPVDLSELARAVFEELRMNEPERHVEVHIEPDLHAVGDQRLLEAAMQNLLANAWKFTEHRNPAVIEFGRMNHGSTAAFFVRDNGAGFDMQHAERLFAPFQRLHAESEFQGTGIGLATVQRIISRHRGRIWAEAAPEQGATFYFELGAN